jgi:hypothetical protein
MSGGRIGRIGQVKIYVGKCFRVFLNDRQWKSFISTIIIMIIISMVTSGDMFEQYGATRNGSFAIICACIWIGLFNSIQSICRERSIIKREHRTGLHISSYIVAHVIYEFMICVVESFIVMLIVFLKNLDSFPTDGIILFPVLEMYISLFLVVFSSDMLAILISSIVKNENTAMTIMPFILIIQLVMAGVIFELDGVAKMISTLTVSRWGQDAVCAIAHINDMSAPMLTNGPVEEYDSTVMNMLLIWLRLAAFSVVYVILSILMLERVDKDAR